MLAMGTKPRPSHGGNRHVGSEYVARLRHASRSGPGRRPGILPRKATPAPAAAGVGRASPRRPQPVAELARQHQVSRKFLYQQADTAQLALEDAFDPPRPNEQVLFHLPVTKSWLRQLVLALVLTCHSPYRGVIALLGDLFDTPLSLGTVHNVVQAAVARAQEINGSYDLAGVRVGAHDEIFQAGRPVLVGVDTASTFCYLLSPEEHRDADTWGVRLLELAERGFAPEATVADFGTGLRAGQDLALPEVPCRGDVFHLVHDLEQAVSYLENRAYDALDACARLERSRPKCDGRAGRRRRGPATAASTGRLRLGHRLGGRGPAPGGVASPRRAGGGRAVLCRPLGVV